MLDRTERRRRFAARLTRPEFWPDWARHGPVVPYMVWLGLRHGSLTAFTAANPGLPLGGFIGERKAPLLDKLAADAPDLVPPHVLVTAAEPEERVAVGRRFVAANGWPVVCKPDVGQRAHGVVIARDADTLDRALATSRSDHVLQGFVPGVELGLLYLRHPDSEVGRLAGIGRKESRVLVGDGRSTLRELVLSLPETLAQADVHLARLGVRAASVPARGEAVSLGEVGAHSGGARFSDAEDLRTPALEQAVERAGRALSDFHVGRFDVRAASLDAVRAGEIQIIEVNGVGAEPVSLLDGSVGPLRLWAGMAAHRREAYAIGGWHARHGAPTSGIRGLLRGGREYRAQRAGEASD